jgi:hypothetical protein
VTAGRVVIGGIKCCRAGVCEGGLTVGKRWSTSPGSRMFHKDDVTEMT